MNSKTNQKSLEVKLLFMCLRVYSVTNTLDLIYCGTDACSSL